MRNCYITGTPTSHETFYGERVFLPVSQEAFAHFVIRAGKDAEHVSIMARIKDFAERRKNFEDEYLAGQNGLINGQDHILSLEDVDQESYIDIAIKQARFNTELSGLLTEKAESGIRILKVMKTDYLLTKKLSS